MTPCPECESANLLRSPTPRPPMRTDWANQHGTQADYSRVYGLGEPVIYDGEAESVKRVIDATSAEWEALDELAARKRITTNELVRRACWLSLFVAGGRATHTWKDPVEENVDRAFKANRGWVCPRFVSMGSGRWCRQCGWEKTDHREAA